MTEYKWTGSKKEAEKAQQILDIVQNMSFWEAKFLLNNCIQVLQSTKVDEFKIILPCNN